MTSIQKINHASPRTLFQKVKEEIRKDILSGKYGPHEKLPSEREMIIHFQVSRITVRQALSELQREGLIFKINGKGTYVSKPKARFDISTLRGFGEWAATIGKDAFSRVIDIETNMSDAKIASQLQIGDGTLITSIKRLRYLSREPISFDVTYAKNHIGEKLATADLDKKDILDVLENECGVSISSADVNIEASIANSELSQYLEISEGAPVLMIERTIYDNSNEALLYENLYYRGDVFKYGMTIERSHI